MVDLLFYLSAARCSCKNIERMIGRIDNENKETYILGDLNCDLLDQANLDKWRKAFVANLRGISAYAINN